MKFVLLTIMAFHYANFGEAQVTTSPLIPDYCDCANLWIQKTVDFLGLSASVTPNKLAKKIMINFMDAAINPPDTNVGCFAKYPDLKNMFLVSNFIITSLFTYIFFNINPWEKFETLNLHYLQPIFYF